MNTLQLFTNNELNISVETIILGDIIYFNARHIADALEIVNHRDSFANFESDELVKLTNELITSNVGSTYIRKLHNTGENFLTEAGLYKAIFQSRNPKAKDVQRWVFHEVLPAIRKTGSYGLQEKIENLDKKVENFDKKITGLDCRIMKLEGFLINFIQAIDAKKDNILPALPLTDVLDNLEKDKPVILDEDKPVILDNPNPPSIGLVTMLGKYKISIHNRTKRLKTHIRKYQVYIARYKRKMIYLGKEYNESMAIERIKAYEARHKIEPSLLDI